MKRVRLGSRSVHSVKPVVKKPHKLLQQVYLGWPCSAESSRFPSSASLAWPLVTVFTLSVPSIGMTKRPANSLSTHPIPQMLSSDLTCLPEVSENGADASFNSFPRHGSSQSTYTQFKSTVVVEPLDVLYFQHRQ